MIIPLLTDSDFDFYVDVENPQNLDPKALVRLVNRELKRRPLFSDVICILAARTPIIKCVHTLTGFSLDLNFSNPLGVYNTKFLHFVLRYDPRIHLLAMLIKFWGKVNKLTGTGRLTNYTLMLLIIFYLQNLENPVLPPVSVFQVGCKQFMVGTWNYAFNKQLNNKATKNRMSMIELFAGFFRFYDNFEFGTTVVCPLVGKPVLKSAFEKPTTLDQSFDSYRAHLKETGSFPLNVNTELCVQDPFELSHNVAASCTPKTFKLFRQVLAPTLAIFDKNSEIPVPMAQMLLMLFSEIQLIEQPKLAKADKVSSANQIVCKLNRTKTDMKYVRKLMSKAGDTNAAAADATNVVTAETIKSRAILECKEWVRHTLQIIEDSLLNIFHFKIVERTIDELTDPELRCQQDIEVDREMCRHLDVETDLDCWTHLKPLNPGLAQYIAKIKLAAKQLYDDGLHPAKIRAKLVIRVPANYEYLEIYFDETNEEKPEEMKQEEEEGTETITSNDDFKRFLNYFSINIRQIMLGFFIDLVKDEPAVREEVA